MSEPVGPPEYPDSPFPHCSATTIHAPGECHYCDLYPHLQRGREVSGEPFSPGEGNGWSGNVAVQAGQVHSHMGGTFVVGENERGQVVRPGDVRPPRVTVSPPLPPTSGGLLRDPDIDWLERRTIRDGESIADLYERIAWLSLPWHRRAFRRPPWLRRSKA